MPLKIGRRHDRSEPGRCGEWHCAGLFALWIAVAQMNANAFHGPQFAFSHRAVVIVPGMKERDQ
ncbi:MAG TPA: hypothetical protein DF715_15310 [Oceanicaulis sp.]|nr:hypothetical protein [Oceanicaulis sp.]